MQRITLYLWPLLLVLAGFGWSNLRLASDIESTLGRSTPSVDAFITINERYSLGEQVRLMLCADDASSTLPEQAIDELREAIRSSSQLESLGVAAELGPEAMARAWIMKQIPTGRAWLDEAGLAELRQRLEPDAMAERFARHRLRLATPQPAEVTRQMLKDPLALRELIPRELFASDKPSAEESLIDPEGFGEEVDPLTGERNAEGNAWLLRLSVPFAAGEISESIQLQAELESIRSDFESDYPDLSVYLAGPQLLAAESARRVKADVQTSLIFACTGIMAVFLIVWRRVIPVFVLFTATAAAVFTAFGLYGLTGWGLSPLAALCGGMLAGLGVDYGIHVLNDVDKVRVSSGESDESPFRVSASLARPIVTACLTTTIGFLALSATEPTALKQLALLGSLGLICAGLASLTLLPFLAGLLRVRVLQQSQGESFLLRWVCAHCPLLRSMGLILGISLFMVALFMGGSATPGQLHDLHPQPNPAIQAQEQIDERFGVRAGSVLVLIDAENTQQLQARLELLSQLYLPFEITSAARLLPPVGRDAAHAKQLADLAESNVGQRILHAAEEAGFRTEAFEPSAQFVERFVQTPSNGLEQLAKSDQGKLFFPTQFDPEFPQTIAVLTPQRTWDTYEKRRQDLAALNRALSRDHEGFRETGIDVISEALRQQITGDLLLAFAWSAVPILLLLYLSLRSVPRTLLTVLPPVLGLLAAVIVMRMNSGHWNAINLAAVPLLLGIGVDASLLLGDAASRGDLSLIRRRLRGIHLTFLTTFIGFGSLSWTSIPAVRELGWMVIAGLGAVLLGTWLFFLARPRSA
jgi:hypothetical protein